MTAAASPALERLPQVLSRVAMSRSQAYRLIAAGKFPAPIRLGERMTAFDSAEVDRWIADQIAARDAKAAS